VKSLNSDSKGDSNNARDVFVGLLIALCCSVIGLAAVFVAIFMLRRNRLRTPVIGLAGADEMQS